MIKYIRGMQSQGVACIAKHFLGYAETQGGLNVAATRMNDRELYEVFATPFEAADKEAHVSGMMASYSEIDGMPVGTNKKIARELLRDTMGFEGMLTSAQLLQPPKPWTDLQEVQRGSTHKPRVGPGAFSSRQLETPPQK